MEKAIAEKKTFTFETTLGGHTITSLLIKAAEEGVQVKVWYAGLESVQLHMARVKARVDQGGHHIPAADIQRRWNSSRRNLIKLMPHLHSLWLYDNSYDADPHQGLAPKPKLLIQVDTKTISGDVSANAPDWAKPLIAAELNTYDLS